MVYAVFWIANGFDPENPDDVDNFSKAALEIAANRYWALKRLGQKVHFPIINSIVKDKSGKNYLCDVLWQVAQRRGINTEDMCLTDTKTTGSPTDGLAITKFSKDNPGVKLEAYATTKAVAEYFQTMYIAVAKWIEHYELKISIYYQSDLSSNVKSRFLYRAMQLVTLVTSQNRFTFKIWYNFLNWAYTRRLKSFTKTVD